MAGSGDERAINGLRVETKGGVRSKNNIQGRAPETPRQVFIQQPSKQRRTLCNRATAQKETEKKKDDCKRR